ncbi:MAG: DUF4397 domain-containing protein [Polyangiaceae bacterium]
MSIRNFLAVGLFGAALVVSGCDDNETTSETGGSGGSGGAGAEGGAGGATGGTGGATGGTGGAGGGEAMASVRVAHLSSDAPAVDFCVSPDGVTFVGPVMNKLLGDSDGLAFSEVTAYLSLPPATYTARLVAPGADTCDESLAGLPDVKDLAVADGGFYTVAAIGMLAPPAGAKPFEVTAYVDDGSVAAGKAKLRFVHASADTPNVDVGTGEKETFAAVFTNVAFSETGKIGGKDYLETEPLSGVTISARATGTDADALVIPGVNLPEGAIASAFAIGNLSGAPSPLKVLVCVDNGAPEKNLTPCVVVP